MSIGARLAILLASILLLSGAAWRIHTKADQAGYARAQAEFSAQAFAESEAARAKEAAMTKAIQEVDHAHQIEKKRLAAAAANAAGQLRQLQAALGHPGPADSSCACRVDESARAVASECAGALTALDEHAASTGARLTALQTYVANACQAGAKR